MSDKRNYGLSTAAKRFLCALLVALPLTLGGVGSVHAQGARGCSLIGSWFGYDEFGSMYWTATHTGQNSSKGTSNLEVPSFDATLGGFFPDAEKITIARGSWKRLDGYTFAGAAIAMAVDAVGQTEYVLKVNGKNTLSAGCNSMWLEVTLEIYLPNQNPFTEDSFFDPIPLPGHPGYRMTAD